MKLSVTMEPGERNTPIALAEAIINSRMDWIHEYDHVPEEDIRREQDYLAEVAQHIQVYLRYNRV